MEAFALNRLSFKDNFSPGDEWIFKEEVTIMWAQKVKGRIKSQCGK